VACGTSPSLAPLQRRAALPVLAPGWCRSTCQWTKCFRHVPGRLHGPLVKQLQEQPHSVQCSRKCPARRVALLLPTATVQRCFPPAPVGNVLLLCAPLLLAVHAHVLQAEAVAHRRQSPGHLGRMRSQRRGCCGVDGASPAAAAAAAEGPTDRPAGRLADSVGLGAHGAAPPCSAGGGVACLAAGGCAANCLGFRCPVAEMQHEWHGSAT
jgi:hypothetical protein